ncbi:unnamed protein product, partial [marine sediment metagenome]
MSLSGRTAGSDVIFTRQLAVRVFEIFGLTIASVGWTAAAVKGPELT